VGAISAAGHRKKKAFTGKITDIVTKFHLDHCEMVAALDSEVARLAGAYSDSGASQEDGSEGGASQEDGSTDTRSFFVAPVFTCSGKKFHKKSFVAISARGWERRPPQRHSSAQHANASADPYAYAPALFQCTSLCH
jgi:hypothetical protein